jgi:hypothetical protein
MDLRGGTPRSSYCSHIQTWTCKISGISFIGEIFLKHSLFADSFVSASPLHLSLNWLYLSLPFIFLSSYLPFSVTALICNFTGLLVTTRKSFKYFSKLLRRSMAKRMQMLSIIRKARGEICGSGPEAPQQKGFHVMILPRKAIITSKRLSGNSLGSMACQKNQFMPLFTRSGAV